jgi:hypothetical protein
MSVWIAQCLCPARHAILAAAGECDSEAEAIKLVRAPLTETIADLLELQQLNPWCGLCNAHAETWIVELGRTRFATMAEAEPMLRQNEVSQQAARIVFGDMKGPKH